MKRDRDRAKAEAAVGAAAAISSCKAKTWAEQHQADAGMDELFAVLGYKVKSSDMADVAVRLEQLEMAIGSTMEDRVSVLSNDAVLYNPSDISGWVESMLSELSQSCGFDIGISGEQQHEEKLKFMYDDDLRAIPGGAIFSNDNSENGNKKMRSSAGPEFSQNRPPTAATAPPSRPVVLLDSQEAGVRLVHSLMACAEAVQIDDMNLADALVKHVGILAFSQAGAMRRVATYFAEALARKIYKIHPRDSLEPSYFDVLQMHFYETAPYMKFAHFTTNQAILEAFGGAARVHVIDFSLKQGMQWPALMEALARRPGGPPAFRLTGIGQPQLDNMDALHEVGLKLVQFAKRIGIEFEFRGFVTSSLPDLDANMLEIRPELETVAVNSVFELHRMLARPGEIEKVLSAVKAMGPKIFTVVEQEANHNGNDFLDRFNEALHYYSTMFDSLESSYLTQPSSQDLVMTELYLGRHICNVVACDGAERVERHEMLAQWRVRMDSAGFDPVHLCSNAFKQASMLLALFADGDGYRVEENDGCLMLGWHTRPLIATSAWRLRTGE